MCTRGIEPQTSCKNLNALNQYKLLVSGDIIASTLPGTYGRRVSPPTRPQGSVTTSRRQFSSSSYFSTSFSAKVFDLVYAYNIKSRKLNPSLKFPDFMNDYRDIKDTFLRNIIRNYQ